MLGRYIADSLATYLFEVLIDKAGSKLSVELVERTRLSAILRELKLSAAGLVNPENAKKIGNIAGVDALIVGNMVRVGDAIAVNLRVISTENARILSARQFRIVANSSLIKLLKMRLKSSATFDDSTNLAASDESEEYMEGEGVVKTSYFLVKPLVATHQNGNLQVAMALKNYSDDDVFVVFLADFGGDLLSSITTSGGGKCKVERAVPFAKYRDGTLINIFGKGAIIRKGTETSISLIAACDGEVGNKVLSTAVGLRIGIKKCAESNGKRNRKNSKCEEFVTNTSVSVKSIPIKDLAANNE